MTYLSKFEKKTNKIILAILIGVVFASVAFFVQHTAAPLQISLIKQSDINAGANSDIQTVYNGVNQVKITGYSAIFGIDSKNTQITVFAVPQGGDMYTGYQLPGYQYENTAPITVYGGGQEYKNAGVAANCYASQIPRGTYNIGILTTASNGSTAYKITNQTFQNGLDEDVLNVLFFVFSFIIYSFFAFLCLEMLFRKKTINANDLSQSGIPKKHSLLSILNILFLAIFFWIFLNVTFVNFDIYANIETFNAGCTVWSAVVIFIVMYSFWQGGDYSAKHSAKAKILIAAGCIAFFLFQLAVCGSLSGQITSFDSTQIASSAFSYIQNGSVTYNPQYFVLNPNNYSMLLTDIGLYKLAGGSRIYFEQLSYFVNIVLLDISIALSYLCIKELAGRKAAAIMLIPLCLIIGLNPMMNMFYTDILSMVFTVLIFFLYLKLRKTNKLALKIVFLIFIALSAYVGYQYKITTIIILIAIAVIELITHIKEWKKLVCIILSCATVFGIVFTLNVKTDDYTSTAPMLNISLEGNPDLAASSVWHYIMLGLNYPYGTFSQKDWDFSITRPKETRDAQIRGVIAQRLSSYGPAGYLAFLNNKAIYAFGESTFSVGNGTYGNDYTMPDTLFSKLLQDIFGSSGKWFPLFAYTLQGVWVLCLFLIVCPLFFKYKKKVDKTVSILRLSIAGILVYLLLSENNTRQLVNQLPVIMILASFSLAPVMNGCKSLTGKVFKKREIQ